MTELKYQPQQPVEYVNTIKGIKYQMQGDQVGISGDYTRTNHHRILSRINPEKWADKKEVKDEVFANLRFLDKKYNTGKHRLYVFMKGKTPQQYNQALEDWFVKNERKINLACGLSSYAGTGIASIGALLGGPAGIPSLLTAFASVAVGTSAIKDALHPEVFAKKFQKRITGRLEDDLLPRIYNSPDE